MNPLLFKSLKFSYLQTLSPFCCTNSLHKSTSKSVAFVLFRGKVKKFHRHGKVISWKVCASGIKKGFPYILLGFHLLVKTNEKMVTKVKAQKTEQSIINKKKKRVGGH